MPKIVAVTFNDRTGYTGSSSQGKHYHYKTDLALKVGDVCVVDAPSGTALVTVRSLEPVGGIRHATKWIVSKVDRERFDARRALEAQIADARVEVENVVNAALVKRQRERLAADYPEVAAALGMLTGLEAALAAVS